MKKLLVLAVASLLTCLLLTGCTSVTGISLPATLEVEQGQPVELAVTYTYKSENASAEDKAAAVEKLGLAWASSGPAVAVGADGSMTAAEGGTATVTASSADGQLTASCTVTVTVPVTGVEAPPELALTLNVTESATLGVKVLPADASDTALTYSSSDTAVATVATDGTVTAVGKGTATITTASANGKQAATKVTVGVAATELGLDKKKMNLAVGGSAALKATLAPEAADPETITWSSSDSSVATVDATGKIKAVGKGTATITAATEGGLRAECAVTVTAASQGGSTGSSSSGAAGTSGGSAQGGGGVTPPAQNPAPAPAPDPAPAPEPEQPSNGEGGYQHAGSPSVGVGSEPDPEGEVGDLT